MTFRRAGARELRLVPSPADSHEPEPVGSGVPSVAPRQKSLLVAVADQTGRSKIVGDLAVAFPDVRLLNVGSADEARLVWATGDVDGLVVELGLPGEELDGAAFLHEVSQHRGSTEDSGAGLRLGTIVLADEEDDATERWLLGRLAFAVLPRHPDPALLTSLTNDLLRPHETAEIDGATLSGLCHLLRTEQRTCELWVVAGERAGRMVFRDGLLVEAVHDEARGDAAAMDILTWYAPRIHHTTRVATTERPADRVVADLMDMVADAIKVLDERGSPRASDSVVQRLRATTEAASASWAPAPAQIVRPTAVAPAVNRTPTLTGQPAWTVEPSPPVVAPPAPPPASSRSGVSSAVDGSSGASAASLLAVFPAVPAAVPSSLHLSQAAMSSIQETLHKLNSLDGFVTAALVDADTGMVLGAENTGSFNVEMAAAANTEVVRAKRKAMQALDLNDELEDILITLGKQYHLIRPMRERKMVFFYLVVERSKANLAMTRMRLAEAEKQIAF
jgi:predicted regulator of Ras-like GTPase activity (Roadblock/LC7/MglB family)